MATVDLRPDERAALERFIQTTHDTRALKRAQALLWLAAGETLTAVARRQLVSRQTVYSWIATYQQRAGEPLETRLADRPRAWPGRGPLWNAAKRALEPILDRPPRDYGYDVPLWSTPLLQDYLAGEGIPISRVYVRRLLRALNYRYKRPRYRLIRRSPTWRQAKGGSSAG